MSDGSNHDRVSTVIRCGRLAVTLTFGIVCVVFFVWWIRSYWYIDGGHVPTLPGQHIAFHGGSGRMCVWFEHSSNIRTFSWRSRPNEWNRGITAAREEDRLPLFDIAFFWPTMTRVYVAHWLMMASAGALACLPWIPWRFSTRGLFAAITLLAGAFGAVLFIDRTW